MARVLPRHIILHIIFCYTFNFCESSILPEFRSVTIVNITDNNNFNNLEVRNVEFEVRGSNIFKGIPIKATTERQVNGVCKEDPNYKISEIWTYNSIARYVVTVPKDFDSDLYLCLPNKSSKTANGDYVSDVWINQGENAALKLSQTETFKGKIFQKDSRIRRDKVQDPIIIGIRLEDSQKDSTIDDNGVPEILANMKHKIRIFGFGFTPNMKIIFTTHIGQQGDICPITIPGEFVVDNGSVHDTSATVDINLPVLHNAEAFFVCIKYGENNYVHQGKNHWLKIKTFEKLLPLYASIIIICSCLTFSALFSGLNLGLMSLDRTELKILCNTGTPKERSYASVIQPVRNHGNYLLCSILLGNVFVNSIFTILLDDLTSGLIAVVSSTLAIVIFGEITPQAICSRHGLAVGAKTIHITKFVMLLTFPLSYPISKLLDVILGEEIGNIYNRERLKELVKVTTGENDLDKDEVNIISGALDLRKKTVADVMTRIEDVFMLDYEAILDFETVSEIMKSGFSRIPVYEGNRQNIVTMLYIKDLAFVDPDDNTPLKTLCQFYQNPCNFVFEDVTLDVMFKIFKEGNKGHMAFVHRVNSEGEGDPFYETIGLITLEDVIEELIQAEIMDETDVFTDNRSKRRRIADRTRQDFTVFAERRGENNRLRISPQLTLATYQYLSTSVDAFNSSYISETILRRLLKQDIIFHIKKNKDWRNDPSTIIYQQGKPADYFVLILEGRVEVMVGKENLMFESGPFTYFGTQALVQNVGVVDSPSVAPSTIGSLESLNLDAMLRHTFQPDYTVRACTEVLYMRVKRSLYLAAKRATLMERSQKDSTTNEQFDDEVEKLNEFYAKEDVIKKGLIEIRQNRNSSISIETEDAEKNRDGNVDIGDDTDSIQSVHDHKNDLEKSENPGPSGLLHSLEEDDTSIGRRTPRRSSSKNLSQQKDSLTTMSQNTSPKASLYSNVSPPHRTNTSEINGDIKSTSVLIDNNEVKGEEEALLLKQSL